MNTVAAHNTHDTRDHPVYSDFSHIAHGNDALEHTRFAITLRDDGKQSNLIERILPLTKIIPLNKIDDEDNIICNRPECILLRSRYEALKIANEPFKQEIKDSKKLLINIKNTIKDTNISENELKLKNIQLNDDINRLQVFYDTLLQDTIEYEDRNYYLRSQLTSLSTEVESLRVRKTILEQDLVSALKTHGPVSIHFTPTDSTTGTSGGSGYASNRSHQYHPSKGLLKDRADVLSLGRY